MREVGEVVVKKPKQRVLMYGLGRPQAGASIAFSCHTSAKEPLKAIPRSVCVEPIVDFAEYVLAGDKYSRSLI